MIKIEQFIDKNYNEFSQLESSEVCELELTNEDLSDEIIDYLKQHYRFDYKGICVYLPSGYNQVWIENMLAE